MKYLIFDANNIANMGFYRAKSIMMKEMRGKTDDEKTIILKEAIQNISGFSLHLFFNKIHSIMKLNKDYRPIFIWDGRYGSSWRKKHTDSYKSNRKHDGDQFYPKLIEMMNTARDVLINYPVLQFVKEDAEADDLIYSVIKLLQGDEIKVVSTDTDMIQLPQQFNNIEIWNPKTKKNHIIPEYDYVLFKSVIGDKSDNIDGVPKYGDKKSAKVAIEGIQTLKEEHREIVKKNIVIIDLSKNPYEPENEKYIKDNYISKVDYDLDGIKKDFFDLKLKQQVDKFGSTIKLLKTLP